MTFFVEAAVSWTKFVLLLQDSFLFIAGLLLSIPEANTFL